MTLTDAEQASALADVKEGRGHVSSKNLAALVPLDRAIVTLGGVAPPPPPPPPPPPGGSPYVVDGTGRVIVQDLVLVQPPGPWHQFNPGPSSRYVRKTSGGDPHRLIDGTTNGNWLEITALPGDVASGRIRMQMGSSRPANTFHMFNPGECTVVYWSCRWPNIGGSQNGQIWEIQETGGGEPQCTFSRPHPPHVTWQLKPDEVWTGGQPDTWSRFALACYWHGTDGQAKSALWGELAGNPDAPLVLLAKSSRRNLIADHPSGFVAGIYGDGSEVPLPHSIGVTNWQVCEFDKAKLP